MKSLITQVLDDLRVQGKFNQDGLVIGKGVSEQVTFFMGDTIQGTPTITFNNILFYRRPDLDEKASDDGAGGKLTLIYGNAQEGTPNRVLYCSPSIPKWYGETYTGGTIGYNMPLWEATGGTATSPEGTVWGAMGGTAEWPSTVGSIGDKPAPGIRFTPGVAGERIFTVLGMTDHPVFDEQAVLKPYPKPTNGFTDMWVLAEEDTVWVSDVFQDENFPNLHYIMYIGGADGPTPNVWRIHTISSGSGELGLDWNGTNTPDFLGAQTGVTWNNGEASAYPASVDDWSTNGYQGVKPSVFSMENKVGSEPKLEFAHDGQTWQSFVGGKVDYTPIPFVLSDLSDGNLHIQHNQGKANVMCLGYTRKPRNITYNTNELILDYGDLESGSGSTITTSGNNIIITGAGTAKVNGTYVPIDSSSSDWPPITASSVNPTYVWASDTTLLVIYTGSTAASHCALVDKGWNGSAAPYYTANNLPDPTDPTTGTWTRAAGAAPVPGFQSVPNTTGYVWFIGSDPSMVVAPTPPDPSKATVRVLRDDVHTEDAYAEAVGDYQYVSGDGYDRIWRKEANGFVTEIYYDRSSWYIMCKENPTVPYEFDLYHGTVSAENPWDVEEWEDLANGNTHGGLVIAVE